MENFKVRCSKQAIIFSALPFRQCRIPLNLRKKEWIVRDLITGRIKLKTIVQPHHNCVGFQRMVLVRPFNATVVSR